MRVISGYAKGLRLKSPSGRKIRPTSDRAREALFSILGESIRNAIILDLFAGTGALGIEALSRGARHATFVDNNPDALVLIKKNLQLLPKNISYNSEGGISSNEDLSSSVSPSFTITKCDLRNESFFTKIVRKSAPNCFNVIFLDPPYAKGLSLQALTCLDRSNLLCDGGIIVAEDTPGTELPEVFKTLTVVDKRRYGDTGFWLYKKLLSPESK